MPDDNLYVLRGVITTDDNDYFISNNTVKVTDKTRWAANYKTQKAASNAASYLCDHGDPYVVSLSSYDQSNDMTDQLYVLATCTGRGIQYFVAACPDEIKLTHEIDEAAHYLSVDSAHDASMALTGFDVSFYHETNGFWSE